MRVALGVIFGVMVMCFLATAIAAFLPVAWFNAMGDSVPPADKAAYLSGLFDELWVLSVACGTGSFLGGWVFSASGGVSRLSGVIAFSLFVSVGFLFTGETYLSGAVLAFLAAAFSMLGGVLGRRNLPNMANPAGTP